VAQDKKLLGLSTAGKNVLGASGEPDMGVVVVRPDAPMEIALNGESIDTASDVDAVELPLLVDKGAVLPSASRAPVTHGKDAPPMRGALGIRDDGRVLLASGDKTMADLAKVLVQTGCTRVVALDRGARASTTIRRAGTTLPPLATSEETTLFALGLPMRPRGFHFTGAGAKK
jgi:hypothetical protein